MRHRNNISGRGDTEAIVLLASTLAGLIGGWWWGDGLLYGLVGALGLPMRLAMVVVALRY